MKKLLLQISQYSQKIPVLDSVFNQVTGLQVCKFIKRDSNKGVFNENCEIFKNAYFEENLWTAASE